MREPLAAAHDSPSRLAAVVCLSVLLIAGMLTPLIAVQQTRTFIPEDVAYVSDATTTTRPIAIAGLQIFMTHEGAGNVRRLLFTVDPQRIAQVDQGLGAGPEPAIQGQTYELVTASNDFLATFEHLWHTSLAPVTDAHGVTHVLIPYPVGEGGCQAGELPGPSCTLSPYSTFLNGDSDPFDVILHYARIQIDPSTQTATIVERAHNTGAATIHGAMAVVPGPSYPAGEQKEGKDLGNTINAKIVFTHYESEFDHNCIQNGNQLTCNPGNTFGANRNNDQYFSDIIAIFDTQTHGTTYTALKAGQSVYGFDTPDGCGAQPVMDVDGFGMVGGTTGLIAFSSQEFADTPFMDAGPVGCSLPARPGVQYNADGDAFDTAIRYATVEQLAAGASLTTGPTLSNHAGPPASSGGALWAADSDRIYYGLKESQFPAAITIPPPMPGVGPCHDLNEDCDDSDFVLHAFNTTTATAVSLFTSMVETPGVSRAENGFVSFATREADERDGFSMGTDFNGDNDFNDTQLRFYDIAADTLVTTNLTLEDKEDGAPTPDFTWIRPSTDGTVIVYGTIPYPIGAGTITALRLIRLPGEPDGDNGGESDPLVCQPGSYLASPTDLSCTPAPPGSYVDSVGATSATLCAAGSYQPLTGQASCVAAPPGTFVPVAGATMATPCPPGSTSEAGATFCTPLDNQPPTIEPHDDITVPPSNGTVAFVTYEAPVTHDNVDPPGVATCNPPSGSFFAIGTTLVKCTATDTAGNAGHSSFNVTVTEQCVPGTYRLRPDDLFCTAAPPGSFVDSFGATKPTLCAPGSYQPHAGQTKCILSPEGSFVPNSGATHATACPAGTTSPVGAIACTDNQPPTIEPHDDITVPPGNGTVAFVTYEAPVTHDNVDPPGIATCNPPSGSFFAIGTTLVKCIATDTAGNIGHSSFNVTVTPQCVPGTYRLRPDDLFCTAAPPGSFVDSFGATKPTLCAPGSYQPNAGQTKCILSPEGSFVPNPGATHAMACPAGTTSPVGAIACTDNQPPSIEPHDDITVPPGNGTVAFVTYEAPVTHDNFDPDGVATCTPPSGSFFAIGTTLVKCIATDAAGNIGHSSFNVTVTPQCVPGTYRLKPNDLFCTAAPPGSFVDTFGATKPTLCAPGSYQPIAGQTKCILSPAGSFVPDSGATHATACPAGTTSPVGAIACTDNQPPSIEPHDDITVPPTNGSAAFVTYDTPKATDNVDGPVVATCVPPSGSVFFAGTTLVKCTATDTAGNIGHSAFNVNVVAQCAPGMYRHKPTDLFCTPAPAGSFVDTVGATTATPCQVGTYQPLAGQIACIAAPAGSFVDTTGAASATECAAGSFQPLSGQSKCTLAPPGTFAAGTGLKFATNCPAGTFQPNSGAISCHDAPAGSFVDLVGQKTATPCAPGTYQPNIGQMACLASPPGSFVDSFGATAATPCPPGTTSGAGAIACTDNQPPSIEPHADITVPPSNGTAAFVTYQAPVTHDNVDPDGVAACTPPSGSFFAGGTTLVKCTATDAAGNTAHSSFNVTVAPQCVAGTYRQQPGDLFCTPAPAGSFVDTIGATAATRCPVGTYQPLAGQTACHAAPAGSFVDTIGATTATECPAGSFQPNTGQSHCTLAPPGSFVAATGQQTSTACPLGTYQPNAGAMSCIDAPAGSFVDTIGSTASTECPAGSFQPNTGQSHCTPAPPGSFVPATGQQAPTACPVGTYQPNSGALSCTDAPAGSFVSAIGQSSATECAPGTYQPAAGQSACILSPAGSFVPNAGATAPTPCPAGTTSAAGATSCTDEPSMEGRMQGDGSVDSPTATGRFDFNVREREPNGERGRMMLDVNYKAKGRKSDTFRSRTVTSVAFSDDPGFKPSRKNKPLTDSVMFAGDGTWNGDAGYSYVARATDRGEPGRGVDTFEITVRNAGGTVVATFTGVIQTGNIQSLRLR